MEIDYVFRVKYLPPMYHDEYDPMEMPRVAANPFAVNWLVANITEFEQAQMCDLGEVPDMYLDDVEYLKEHITDARISGGCPTGTYVVRNYLFRVSDSLVELLNSWQD